MFAFSSQTYNYQDEQWKKEKEKEKERDDHLLARLRQQTKDIEEWSRCQFPSNDQIHKINSFICNNIQTSLGDEQWEVQEERCQKLLETVGQIKRDIDRMQADCSQKLSRLHSPISIHENVNNVTSCYKNVTLPPSVESSFSYNTLCEHQGAVFGEYSFSLVSTNCLNVISRVDQGAVFDHDTYPKINKFDFVRRVKFTGISAKAKYRRTLIRMQTIVNTKPLLGETILEIIWPLNSACKENICQPKFDSASINDLANDNYRYKAKHARVKLKSKKKKVNSRLIFKVKPSSHKNKHTLQTQLKHARSQNHSSKHNRKFKTDKRSTVPRKVKNILSLTVAFVVLLLSDRDKDPFNWETNQENPGAFSPHWNFFFVFSCCIYFPHNTNS